MIFLHSEFILLMIPFVTILFYFWLTQKPKSGLFLSEKALIKLRSPDTTLTLKERNILFLCAAILIIIALAQPVIKEKKLPQVEERMTIALDISKRPVGEFEVLKQLTMKQIDRYAGTIELVAFDSEVYRISPATMDKELLRELITNLSPERMQTHIADEGHLRALCSNQNLIIVADPLFKSGEVIKPTERWEYFQLFYLPVGLAMILIALGLSSMSKRQSVSFAFMILLVSGERDVQAGIMDFRTLQEAYSTYEKGDYVSSVRFFREYQTIHDSPQVRYNLANALYKSQRFEEARYWYARVYTTDPHLNRWVQQNISLLPSTKIASRFHQKSEKHKERIQGVTSLLTPTVKENSTPLFRY